MPCKLACLEDAAAEGPGPWSAGSSPVPGPPSPGRDETLEILQGIRAHRESHFGRDDYGTRTLLRHRRSRRAVRPDALPPGQGRSISPGPGVRGVPGGRSSPWRRNGRTGTTPWASPVVTPRLRGPASVAEKMGIPIEVARGRAWGDHRIQGAGARGSISTGTSVGQEEAISRFCRRLVLFPRRARPDRRGRMAGLPVPVPFRGGEDRVRGGSASYLFANERASSIWTVRSTRRGRVLPPHRGPRRVRRLTRRGASSSPGCGHPYSVVLLERRSEKAVPPGVELVLQLFERGEDHRTPRDHTRPRRHAIFIMTGNVPVRRRWGSGLARAAVPKECAGGGPAPVFRPGVPSTRVGRARSSPGPFRRRRSEVLALRIAEASESLSPTTGCAPEMDPGRRDWLAAEGYQPEYGVGNSPVPWTRWIRPDRGDEAPRGVRAPGPPRGTPLRVKKTTEGLRVE